MLSWPREVSGRRLQRLQRERAEPQSVSVWVRRSPITRVLPAPGFPLPLLGLRLKLKTAGLARGRHDSFSSSSQGYGPGGGRQAMAWAQLGLLT